MTLRMSDRRHYMALAAIVAFISLQICEGNIFTAMSEMEELLEAETVLLTNLDKYVGVLEQKLTYLRK